MIGTAALSDTEKDSQKLDRQAPRPLPVGVSVLLTTLYAALIIFLSSYHELWRDEVRALTIALDWHSLPQLFHLLRNEGHPMLWYLLLRAVAMIVGPQYALPVASIAAATAAAYVFVRFAPFSVFAKVLWLFGFYPAYEYAVMNRNYGIGMFLLFVFCACYPSRHSKPLRCSFVLALLALSSLYGLMISCALSLMLISEKLIFERPEFSAANKGPAYIGGKLLFVGAAVLSAWQIMPDRSSIVTGFHSLGPGDFIRGLIDGFVSHGSIAHNAFSSPFPWSVPLLLAGLYFLLIRKPSLMLFVMSLVCAIELTHRTVYSASALRHQGFLFLGVVAALWLDAWARPQILKNARVLNAFEPFRLKLVQIAAVLLFLPQIVSGYRAARLDLRSPMSNASALEQFVRGDARLSAMTLVAEPDDVIDTLSLFVPNKIYLPREKRFGRRVYFDETAQREISLGEVLDSAESICPDSPAGVLLLIPPGLEAGGVIEKLYGQKFTYSQAELARLRNETAKLTSFTGSVFQEDYDVFEMSCSG